MRLLFLWATQHHWATPTARTSDRTPYRAVRQRPAPHRRPNGTPPTAAQCRLRGALARKTYRAESAIRVSIARTRGPDFPRNATKWRSIPAS